MFEGAYINIRERDEVTSSLIACSMGSYGIDKVLIENSVKMYYEGHPVCQLLETILMEVGSEISGGRFFLICRL